MKNRTTQNPIHNAPNRTPRRHGGRHSRSPSPHTSVFKRLKKNRSPPPQPRPRKEGGVFERLGRKEPVTSARSDSHRRSPQALRMLLKQEGVFIGNHLLVQLATIRKRKTTFLQTSTSKILWMKTLQAKRRESGGFHGKIYGRSPGRRRCSGMHENLQIHCTDKERGEVGRTQSQSEEGYFSLGKSIRRRGQTSLSKKASNYKQRPDRGIFLQSGKRKEGRLRKEIRQSKWSRKISGRWIMKVVHFSQHALLIREWLKSMTDLEECAYTSEFLTMHCPRIATHYRKLTGCTHGHCNNKSTDKATVVSSEISGRNAKVEVLLEGYDIHTAKDRNQRPIYWRDFIVGTNGTTSLRTNFMAEPDATTETWTLFTDGSSCVDGSGAGLILTNLEGAEFTYAMRFRFEATNNEAEYEALIAGLRIAEQMGVKNLTAKC
ncbi:reverse transcriptase domain-containing protein [Tanacetum coccineum]